MVNFDRGYRRIFLFFFLVVLLFLISFSFVSSAVEDDYYEPLVFEVEIEDFYLPRGIPYFIDPLDYFYFDSYDTLESLGVKTDREVKGIEFFLVDEDFYIILNEDFVNGTKTSLIVYDNRSSAQSNEFTIYVYEPDFLEEDNSFFDVSNGTNSSQSIRDEYNQNNDSLEVTSCDLFGGIKCEQDEICVGNPSEIDSKKCCVGECVLKEEVGFVNFFTYLLKDNIWIIGIVLVGLIFFILFLFFVFFLIRKRKNFDVKKEKIDGDKKIKDYINNLKLRK